MQRMAPILPPMQTDFLCRAVDVFALRRNRKLRSRPRTLTPHLLDGVDLVVVLDLVDDKR